MHSEDITIQHSFFDSRIVVPTVPIYALTRCIRPALLSCKQQVQQSTEEEYGENSRKAMHEDFKQQCNSTSE